MLNTGFLCLTKDATGHVIFYMGNISVLEQAMTQPISEMNLPYLKTPISICNSLLFTLVLTMYFLDPEEWLQMSSAM